MERENIDNVEDFRPSKPKKQRKTLAKRFGSISDDSAIEVMKKGYVPVREVLCGERLGIQHPVKRFVQQI